MPDEQEEYAPDEAPPFWVFRRWIHRLLPSRKPRLTDPGDIVPPGARPICPRCVRPYERVLQYCPYCDEPVGCYKAWVYPDLIWIWGRGLWRLMHSNRVSRLVWTGMILLALGWLGDGFAQPVAQFGQPSTLYDGALGWMVSPMASVSLAVSLISVVAGMRVLAKAWRLWETWPGGWRISVVTASSEGRQAECEED